MIVPWLRGFQSWTQAPLTWTLILVNFFIFFLTYERTPALKQFSTSREIVLTGRLYQQYTNDIRTVSQEQLILLGSRALREPKFLAAAKNFEFTGDEVAIGAWKKSLLEFLNQAEQKNSHRYGLLTEEWRPLTWVTYQFMHASWMHLFSNMILILIFGAAFELSLGSAALVLTFLLSGIAGGLGFLWWGGHSMAPMVGASGSLSGIMAAYAISETRMRVAFFYFLSPIEGYYGVIYLPTLLIFPLCFVADLASYFATPIEFGAGIAYAAHLGGAAFGIALGLVFRFCGKLLKSKSLAQTQREQSPVATDSR